jgi:predicted RNA binding protein YcfA (HicA-like mRNA interferase family)
VDGRSTTVPFHARDIAPTLLRKIAKDVGLSVQQLLGWEP